MTTENNIKLAKTDQRGHILGLLSIIAVLLEVVSQHLILHVFSTICTRETMFVTFCFPSCTSSPVQKDTYRKKQKKVKFFLQPSLVGKNYLLVNKFRSVLLLMLPTDQGRKNTSDRVTFPASISIPLKLMSLKSPENSHKSLYQAPIIMA